MTRETKIGLLVGLAFIIVIGILLSEHVSSTNEPQQAPLNQAGPNVRDGIVTPGTGDGPPVTIAGAPVDAPTQPVPTGADLRAAPPVAYIQLGGPNHPAPDRGRTPNGGPNSPGPANPPAGTLAAVNPPSNLTRAQRELVQQHPDDLVVVDPNGAARPTGGAQLPARPAPITPPATYTAVAGDSVSRIAARVMGANTRSNRDLLVRANPSLQNEGNVVVIGRTYVIPKVSGIGRPGERSAGIATAGSGAAEPPATPAEPARWYTVKADDNLWKIAQSQLGSGNAWSLIRDLNKDVLKGGETVHANMRLRLPPKTAVAGAE